jgi:hypothetical protein
MLPAVPGLRFRAWEFGHVGSVVGRCVARFRAMGFLKRLLGVESGTTEPASPPATPAEVEADERAYELDLARSEQDRLTDLQQRQLKYSDYAWTPPAQGGTRRADDEDVTKEGDA